MQGCGSAREQGSIQPRPVAAGTTLADKLDFLRCIGSDAAAPGSPVEAVETHMSWVFLVGDIAYKLKKPVAYPFLDFSTPDAREEDCRDELRLNRRLAPGVYLGLSQLRRDAGGRLSLVDEDRADADARGSVVDWLVRMRRLPADRTLMHLISRHAVTPAQVDDLAGLLAAFYGHLPPAELDVDSHLSRLRAQHWLNAELLTRPGFAPGGAALRPLLTAIERFIDAERAMLADRVARGRIVEGHGDLRPEHVFLLARPVVIDCLEFNRELRLVDWADEIAFLGLECERLGAAWIGPALRTRIGAALDDTVPDRLLGFYRALRALLRARLALAHLDEPAPRTPDRWLPLAREYVRFASDAMHTAAAGPLPS